MSPPPLLWLVLMFVLVSRVAEWVVTEHHERVLRARGAVAASKDGLRAIALVHATLFAVLPAEWWLAPWPRIGVHTYVALGAAAVAVGVRYWAAASLGPFYTKRVLRLEGATLVAQGPYRWMRHPIYRAVWIEMVAWPLAFGCYATAGWMAVANALVLRHRIRVEERHLGLA
jgi:methyltransferase